MNLQITRKMPFFWLLAAGLLSYAVVAKSDPGVPEEAGAVEQAAAEPVEVEPQILIPLEVHPRTSLTVVEQLRHNHYVKKPLDDAISSDVFDNYLDALDPGRAYFMAADVEKFEQYRYALDDALKHAQLEPAFEIFNRYQARIIERLQYLVDQAENGIAEIDFTTDEEIEIDREHSPWPADEAQMNDLWRKRLKAAVLAMRLNDKPAEEISELLTKRYKNRLKQALQTKSEDAFQVYVNAFATTYDPHTQYFSPRTSQNFNINMSLSLEGIGAVLKAEDDYTSVVRLVPAGPADKADNIDVADKIISVGQGEAGPLIDVVGWRLDDVVELIRGPKGSTVRLEIIPADSDDDVSKVIAIERDSVQLEEQAAQAKLLTLNQGDAEFRVGVIEIPTFYVDFRAMQQGDPDARSTTKDVRNLITQLRQEEVDALIVDLRNNGGGSLQEADTLTGLFIESGPTVQVKAARRRANVYADTDDSVTWDGPMAVMVNRLSASASEIFAGAIQDYGRGIILGGQTFGKGTVQTLIPLNRGQLKITAAKFYRVSGQSTQHQGVLPDIAFPDLYDTDQIGESSLEDAMPWDMIQPAVYDASTTLAPMFTELQQRHENRVADNVDFAYFRALAEKGKEASLRTHVSLNEATRRAEKAEDDQWRLDLENSLRIAKGKEAATSLDHLEELEEAETDEDADAEETADGHESLADTVASEADADTSEVAKAPVSNTEEDEAIGQVEDDAMLEEAGRILMDMIGLSIQFAQLESVPADPAITAANLPVPQPQANADTDG